MLKYIFIIGIGGFLGTISRYLTSIYIYKLFHAAFPLGTFAINILGCFLIGIFYGLSERGTLMSGEWKLFLTVGFCGGFTTFSTFANENMAMLRDGAFFYAALYTSLSVFLGILATYAGGALTKLI